MDKKKAEEEVSAIITGTILIGIILPAILAWLFIKISVVERYLVDIGILESGERVVWRVGESAGLDLGRILIILGLIILGMVFTRALLHARCVITSQ